MGPYKGAFLCSFYRWVEWGAERVRSNSEWVAGLDDTWALLLLLCLFADEVWASFTNLMRMVVVGEQRWSKRNQGKWDCWDRTRSLVMVGPNLPQDKNYLLYVFVYPSVLGVESVNVLNGLLNFELICSPFLPWITLAVTHEWMRRVFMGLGNALGLKWNDIYGNTLKI